MRLVMPGRNVILDAAAMTETAANTPRKPSDSEVRLPPRFSEVRLAVAPVRNATHG